IASFQQSRDTVHCLAFRRDLSEPVESAAEHPWLLAAGDAGGTVWIYRLGARKLMTICHGSAYNVFAVAFSPDGMTLASGGRCETRLWDVATGRFLVPVKTGDHLTALEFSPDGRWLAFGTISVSDDPAETGVIEVMDGQGVHALRGLSAPSGKPTFSHDGRRLAALAHNWDVAIWNLESKRLERLFRAPKGILADNAALAFSPDDRQLAFATSRQACLWDLESGRPSKKWLLPPGLGQCLCYDPLGRLVHFQWERTNHTEGGVCRVRDLLRNGDTNATATFAPFAGRILDSGLSSDGRLVIVRGEQTTAAETGYFVGGFDTLTGEPVYQLSSANTNLSLSEFVGPMLDPTGRLVAFRDLRNPWSVMVNVSTGSPLRRDLPPLCALGPDGRWFATARLEEQEVTLRRTDDPKWMLSLGVDQRLVQPPKFSADGRWLTWGTRDGAVMVCDIEDIQRRLKEHGLDVKGD
ncbi:MAG TPA: WD40 repeat domain-containing protein, partial [Verrucomicrobiota bacterium]|nr:WD40 repeat domain-containing protein [Verrucomicrobiota bacterium]